LEKFRSLLLPCDRQVIPVLQLGEVDCGFVIWHRAKKHGECVDMQLNESLKAYVGFLRELQQAGYEHIFVTSAMLPTIGDGDFKGDVAFLRKDIGATQRERTDLTLSYNNRLEREVNELGMQFVDFTPHLVDKATGLIAQSFKHPEENDHHLDPVSGGRLWVKLVCGKLAELGLAPKRPLIAR
jgi:hypothetical protein